AGCMCYATAKIITPAGLPLNEEEEEGLLPPELPEVPCVQEVTQASSLTSGAGFPACTFRNEQDARSTRTSRMHVLRHREDHHARRTAVERGRRGRPPPAGAA